MLKSYSNPFDNPENKVEKETERIGKNKITLFTFSIGKQYQFGYRIQVADMIRAKFSNALQCSGFSDRMNARSAAIDEITKTLAASRKARHYLCSFKILSKDQLEFDFG